MFHKPWLSVVKNELLLRTCFVLFVGVKKKTIVELNNEKQKKSHHKILPKLSQLWLCAMEMLSALCCTMSAAQVCTVSTQLGSGFYSLLSGSPLLRSVSLTLPRFLLNFLTVITRWLSCRLGPDDCVFCCTRLEKRKHILQICIRRKSRDFWKCLKSFEWKPNMNKSRRNCGQVTLSILSSLQWPLEATTVQFDLWNNETRSVWVVEGLLGSFPVFIVKVLHHEVLHLYFFLLLLHVVLLLHFFLLRQTLRTGLCPRNKNTDDGSSTTSVIVAEDAIENSICITVMTQCFVRLACLHAAVALLTCSGIVTSWKLETPSPVHQSISL